jgi:hypothetical protein
LNSVCKICSDHKIYRKRNYAKALAISDRENIDSESSVKDDLYGELKKIAPNMTDNQITLITGQINLSVDKSPNFSLSSVLSIITLQLDGTHLHISRNFTISFWWFQILPP